MIIVIPMAGAGSRFPKAVYPEHKSQIELLGKTLLEYSLRSLPIEKSERVIFVVLKSQLNPRMEALFSRLCCDKPFEIVALDNPTGGQAETVHIALKGLPLEMDILIHNCDTAMNVDWDFDKSCDGVVFTFESQSESFSYAKVDDFGFITQVAEKRVISKFASTGTYWFKSVDIYNEAYARQLINNDYKESFVAPLYQELINLGSSIRMHHCKSVYPLGTPSDLEESSKRIKYWIPNW
jgi:NDP-sugar pyrophosphorylase family protein